MIVVHISIYLIALLHVAYSCPQICRCNVTEVHCEYRFLSSIPSNIPTYATHLYLTGNYIREVGDHHFEHLYNLQVLGLSFNRIRNIGKFAFRNLYQLERLVISNNLLGHLNFVLFRNLVNLKRLAVNKIHDSSPLVIEDYTFASLKSLQVLKLSENRLVCIRNKTFKGLYNLRYLDLSSNELEIIDSAAFQYFSNVIIILTGNELLFCCCRTYEELSQYGLITIGFCINRIPYFSLQCENSTIVCSSSLNSTGHIDLPVDPGRNVIDEAIEGPNAAKQVDLFIPETSKAMIKTSMWQDPQSIHTSPVSIGIFRLSTSHVVHNTIYNLQVCSGFQCISKSCGVGFATMCKPPIRPVNNKDWRVIALITLAVAIMCFMAFATTCFAFRKKNRVFAITEKLEKENEDKKL